ncbi:hypothetical protein GOBAR_DD33528 [Gossypium barbadense]|nr:hypothetical protein GOBAR_DD33528 [Gossypium barbadense]
MPKPCPRHGPYMGCSRDGAMPWSQTWVLIGELSQSRWPRPCSPRHGLTWATSRSRCPCAMSPDHGPYSGTFFMILRMPNAMSKTWVFTWDPLYRKCHDIPYLVQSLWYPKRELLNFNLSNTFHAWIPIIK